MTSAIIATSLAFLAALFLELVGSFYPARQTWLRLRRTRGRRSVRSMRERLEATSRLGTPRRLVELLLGLVIIWAALASFLDKRWYEVALDALPYAIVSIALLRAPGILTAVAERMKEYERAVGEDPDTDLDDEDGPEALVL